VIAGEGNDQVSGWGGILLRAAYRLITPRSAAASGRRLTGQHPHAPALLRQCLTGTFLHRQHFSEGQPFAHRAAWRDETRLIAAQSPTKPPSCS
jgi:hypothetical protein